MECVKKENFPPEGIALLEKFLKLYARSIVPLTEEKPGEEKGNVHNITILKNGGNEIL